MAWLILFLIVVTVVFLFVIFKGAPYLPSQPKYIRRALTKLYPISNKDVLVDIGSGDGVILREAAKLGAHAIGYELNPILVGLSRVISSSYPKVQINLADYWAIHLPKKTTVVYSFPLVRDMTKTKQWMQTETDRIGKTIYLISYGASFQDKKPERKLDAYYLYKFQPLHK